MNRAGSLGRVHVNVARVVHKAGSEHERLRGSISFRAALVILGVLLDGLFGGRRVPPAAAPAATPSPAPSASASASASASPPSPAATPADRHLLPGTPAAADIFASSSSVASSGTLSSGTLSVASDPSSSSSESESAESSDLSSPSESLALSSSALRRVEPPAPLVEPLVPLPWRLFSPPF